MSRRSRADEDPAAKLDALVAQGIKLFVVDLPADKLLEVADRAKNALVFNAGATDDRLREEDCRANVIHAAPTRAMLADGLAQYLIWKRWRRWLLVVGSHPEDKLLGDALHARGEEVRRQNRRGAQIQGHRRRRGAPTAAS